jgi:hypothetical protein
MFYKKAIKIGCFVVDSINIFKGQLSLKYDTSFISQNLFIYGILSHLQFSMYMNFFYYFCSAGNWYDYSATFFSCCILL